MNDFRVIPQNFIPHAGRSDGLISLDKATNAANRILDKVQAFYEAEINRLHTRLDQTTTGLGKMIDNKEKEIAALCKRRDVLMEALNRLLLHIKASGHKDLYGQCIILTKDILEKPDKRRK